MSRNTSKAPYHEPDVVDVAEEPHALGDAELGGELLDGGAQLAVAGEHEHAVRARAPSTRTRSSGRLIADSRPAQPITNVVVADAELCALRRLALRAARRRRVRRGRSRSG